MTILLNYYRQADMRTYNIGEPQLNSTLEQLVKYNWIV